MEWVIGAAVVLLAVVFVWLQSIGAPDESADRDARSDYQWGDELHEYSYRHPWDDD